MSTIYYLLPISIVMLVIAILALLWAVQSGQYDDLDRPAHDILLDDAKQKQMNKEKTHHD